METMITLKGALYAIGVLLLAGCADPSQTVCSSQSWGGQDCTVFHRAGGVLDNEAISATGYMVPDTGKPTVTGFALTSAPSVASQVIGPALIGAGVAASGMAIGHGISSAGKSIGNGNIQLNLGAH